MSVECYLRFSMMFLKHAFNHSNTCFEQALKEREIRTQISATALEELKIKDIKSLKI